MTPLFYDREIEYLESTGTQYISLDIVPNFDTETYVKAMPIDWYTSLGVVCGTNTFSESNGGKEGRYLVFCQDTTNHNTTRIVMSNQEYQVPEGTMKLGEISEVLFNEIGTHNVYINGNYFNSFTYGNTVNYQHPLWLCGSNGYGRNQYLSVCRIYHIVIKNENGVVRDLIPVRVGNVGYMFDKITLQLFGNSGSGSFILGPDI